MFEPGDLVFAKVLGWCPWPARLMCQVAPQQFKVFFYGTREESFVKVDCIWPLDKLDSFTRKYGGLQGYAHALQEMKSKPDIFAVHEDDRCKHKCMTCNPPPPVAMVPPQGLPPPSPPAPYQVLPLQDISDRISGWEDKSRKSSGRVIKKKKCQIKLNKIELSSRECDIKISSIDLKCHLQRKRSRVNLKRLKLPFGLGSKISANNNNSRFKVQPALNHLKPNPKTLKQRRTNEEILRNFSQDHCDDMFEAEPIPSIVSKFDLMHNSFSSNASDEEDSCIAQPHTPLTKHLAHFEGWSEPTPDNVRNEDEDAEVRDKEGELGQLAFVHKTLDDRNKGQKIMRKKIAKNLDSICGSEKHSTPRKSRPETLKDFLGYLEPALENQNESQKDMSIDKVEPYFEEF